MLAGHWPEGVATDSAASPGHGPIEAGRAMNPYEATLTNVLARVNAWVRGVLRRYRKPLTLVILATVAVAASVNAGHTPASTGEPPITAPR